MNKGTFSNTSGTVLKIVTIKVVQNVTNKSAAKSP